MDKKVAYKPLSCFLTEYKEKNSGNEYRPVAIGKYGIRTRESIYTKELAADYSKNKVIFKNTLTVGMGSNQIDIGILIDDEIYSVSPAYHTYRITGINPKYLEYCLKCKNTEMFAKYSKRGARQGKSIELKKWLTYEIPVYSEEKQTEIVGKLDLISKAIECEEDRIQLYDELIKSKFYEMFGDLHTNPKEFEKKPLKKTCTIITGNTPPRAIEEYYGNDIEWIKTDNIIPNIVNPTKAAEGLSEEGIKVGRTVDENSILMGCIAGSVKSIGKVCVTDRKVAFNQQINGIVPSAYNAYFLYALFQASKDYLVEGISKTLKGILSKSKLEEKIFIVPPMEQQEVFANFLLETYKLKDCVFNQIDSITELLTAEMHKYFN